MDDVYYLSVFTDADGNHGDTTTVVIDEGRKISGDERQALTRKLNTGETTFINNLAAADISIVHPLGEIDFAGVTAIGAAWLLAKLNGKPIKFMNGRGGAIVVSQDGGLVWVRASLATMPPWTLKQLDSVDAVERIKVEETSSWEHTMVWAWVDEAKGFIRARTFASDWEVPEPMGNGSGSMMLAAQLNRSIEIKHGVDARIFARPAEHGQAELGGRVTTAKPKAMNFTD